MSRIQEEIKQGRPFRSAQEEAFVQLLRTYDLLYYELTEFLRPSGISPTQYNVLRILRGAGDVGLTCGEVGERMVTREPDITRLLDRVERQGWIERRRQTDDRRVVRAWIKAEGLKLLSQIDKSLDRFQRSQFPKMSQEQLDALSRLLEQVRAREAPAD
jgi:DNA-binding MarR family transcriptional regulator